MVNAPSSFDGGVKDCSTDEVSSSLFRAIVKPKSENLFAIVF